MDLNFAVLVGRLAGTPKLRRRSGTPQTVVLQLAVRRPVREGEQQPALIDLVNVAVEGKHAARLAEHLVEDRRIIVGGRLEHRQTKDAGTPTLHLVATTVQLLEPGGPPPTDEPAP